MYTKIALLLTGFLVAPITIPQTESTSTAKPKLATTAKSKNDEKQYANPILRDVADPFVLKHRGEYYLYRTAVNGTIDVHTSRNLMDWKYVGPVWSPDRSNLMNRDLIWAPEVVYDNGTFYLIFSTDTPPNTPNGGHRIWVATATTPTGPFKTLEGEPLTGPWRIDPSVFVDVSGKKYLYTCVAPPPPGQGAFVQGRVLERFHLPLSPDGWETVVPATQEWEGNWTEGPTVIRDPSSDAPRYFMLYSGGGAHLPRYAVGYSVASSPLGPWEKKGLLLSQKPGVAGPGHQGVVLAPDNLTWYLAYHKKIVTEEGWGRDLCLDRLAITPSGLETNAPTLLPQPAPPMPEYINHFDNAQALQGWTGAGKTHVQNGELRVRSGEKVRFQREFSTENGLTMELNLRRTEAKGEVGFVLHAEGKSALITVAIGRKIPDKLLPSTEGDLSPATNKLSTTAYTQYLVRYRPRTQEWEIIVEGAARKVAFAPLVPKTVTLTLYAEGVEGAFDGVAVTERDKGLGIEPGQARPPLLGWHKMPDGTIEQRQLGAVQQVYPLEDKALPASAGLFEATVRGWALGRAVGYPKYGTRVQLDNTGQSYVDAWIDAPTGVLATHAVINGKDTLPWQNSTLPLGFEFTDEHRIAVQWRGDKWQFSVDDKAVQERTLRVPASSTSVIPALVTEDCRAAYRNIRAVKEAAK